MTDKEQVFGIDLGTTYSVIAFINDFGQAEVIRNREGEETTPSVVYFESATSFVVGKEAKNEIVAHHDATVSLIKRSMGTDFPLQFFGTEFRPESISALILKDLVEFAQQATGIDTNKVAITVPAYFGRGETAATRQAAEIAGLEVVGIITEPVAAALSVGVTGDKAETLFVYDLGGGTFDCTVLEFSPGTGDSSGATSGTVMEVLAIDGHRSLGGADWDQRLFELVKAKFIAQAGLGDEDPTEDEDFVQKLTNEVEDLKKSLSRKEKAGASLRYGDVALKVEVTRAEFETATRTLVDQTLDIVRRTLATAQQKRPDLKLEEVLLVGGSSKMPMIQASLENEMGWSLRKTDLDLAVAKGAAIYGQGISLRPPTPTPVGGTDDTGTEERKLAPDVIIFNGEELEIRNALSRSLGLRWVRESAAVPGEWEHFIGFVAHQQESLPLRRPFTGFAAQDNTTNLTIRIYEQISGVEDENPKSNTEVTPTSGATLTNLPNLPAHSAIEFELSISSQGEAQLSAFEPISNQRIDLPITLSVMQAADVAKAKQAVEGMVRA
ncbi:Hsp70 family protein [Cryobacterium aureum]|uniref:Hsp70 family protein n=1 Tax=Cryobacterium aureum TaxID=995037 RepID=UPI000CF56CED|nr:Hsp70 family protein [Cryobacterium aureum]